MTRLPLIHIPFGLYSVVSKCNNNEFLFDSPQKFELYIEHLIHCKEKFRFQIYDVVCMSNHVHELYRVPERVTIADILQRVKGLFSQIFNKKFGRTGHFWRNKPFYRIVENEEYAFATMNYFHWNPVKTGLVTKPEDWPYSGYRFHILNERSGLLGRLLDPLPYEAPQKLNENIKRAVEKIANSTRIRFIGGLRFRRSMKHTYGKLAGSPR